MSNKPLVLIVEDDSDIATLIKINLENNGYRTHIADDGQKALDYFNKDTPSLVILDIMLPEVNGIDVLKNIRFERKLKNLPIIVVSAKSDESDVLTGLELEADDYITKPFSSKILLAKVKSLIRKETERTAGVEGGVINILGLIYDPHKHTATKDGAEIPLTATEFTLLGTLLSEVGRTFSREMLMDAVKGGEYYSLERTIDVQIASLRKKLGDLGSSIKTVWGVGYKWESAK